ncbi:MAG: hypothetical protein GWO83_00970 [Bacteroidia bacterium]|nr:hypothetical protein [Bacteroidia bacterium]
MLAIALIACACQAERTETAADGSIVDENQGTDGWRSALGNGFVVWESNRSGSWRLWRRDLDGSPVRQLTPDEGPRIHCCPHISPDGQWVAYLSLPADQKGYPRGGALGSLRLIRPDGTGDHLLLPEARNYFENRAVVWRSADELVFIDRDRRTALLNLDSGEVTILTKTASEDYPWLIDSQLRFAASGRVSFAPYDKTRREVLERSPVGGCQPYFTHDGRWGFWVAAPGGPIHKIELATEVVASLLKKPSGGLRIPVLPHDLARRPGPGLRRFSQRAPTFHSRLRDLPGADRSTHAEDPRTAGSDHQSSQHGSLSRRAPGAPGAGTAQG